MSGSRSSPTIWNAINAHLPTNAGNPTLITGPSGTGKELVARAIGLSRYIPFDEERTRFARPFDDGFYPNQPNCPIGDTPRVRTFGHRKGSFTGALQDGLVLSSAQARLVRSFLMKSETYSLTTQVKLLRLLQSRIYQRLATRPSTPTKESSSQRPTASSTKVWKTASFEKISIIDSRLTESVRRRWLSRFENGQRCSTRWFISSASCSG